MTRQNDPLVHVTNHYELLLAKYGPGVKAVDWRDEEQRNLRFEVLSQAGNLQGCSIADVGSGLGDLYGFLQKRGWHVKYTGFEMIPRFVTIARERYPSAEFIEAEFLSMYIERKFDWVFLNGSLNVRFDGIEQFTHKVIEKMYAICNRGVAFNLMSTYVDFQKVDTAHNDPEKIFRFCKSLTRFVTLRHDYYPWEFTTYMFRSNVR
jgi:SAM-dependent methyltransferase